VSQDVTPSTLITASRSAARDRQRNATCPAGARNCAASAGTV
jgi:hypothetical protein